HNVRTVLPGRVYRSDQLVGSTLHSVLAQHGIRMVINLRGGSSRDSWYRSEREECARLNVQHCDTAFSATHMPPPGELQKLLQCFDHA
ncbi:hypothetical protein, partial [Klebsiella pneumoniae]|uniref:hypothetical protein n=1 Tax=Klebsiella pneumoniae TaxID=573 RepID=UPI00385362AB